MHIISAASVPIALCAPHKNARTLAKAAVAAKGNGAHALVFPSLCISGATGGELLRTPMLLRASWEAMLNLAKETPPDLIVCASLPVQIGGLVFECAAIIENGRPAALIPRLMGKRRFCFHPGLDTGNTPPMHEGMPVLRDGRYTSQTLGELSVVFSLDAITRGGLYFCPSSDNATLRSPHIARHALLTARSHGACVAYASPGSGESGTDFAFDGRCAALSGDIIESSLLDCGGGYPYAGVELRSSAAYPSVPQLRRDVKFPFLSADEALAQSELLRLLPLQALSLKRRAEHIGSSGFVVGLSGGLDSTLALLGCLSAADRMAAQRPEVLAVTMPGLGTGERTKSNADALAKELGVTYETIPITELCRLHFGDIGQSMDDHSITYENAQARMRTLILMDIANQRNLLFVGSGDLSELALGWTTFGGDHLSSYGINASVPKTMVRKAVELASRSLRFKAARKTLSSISETPVSPELVPGGAAAQQTESILGDYALHDFFIHHLLSSWPGPSSLLSMAHRAFEGEYSIDEIRRTLGILLSRFYRNQFKRNCMPEGPQLTDVSLSTRSMNIPSDADDSLFQLK